MTRRRDILLISPFLPRPDMASGDRRFFALMEMLARDHRVDLVAREDFAERDAYVKKYEQAGVRVLGMECDVASAIRRRAYDLVFFEYYYQVERWAEEIRRVQPWCRIIVDSVDVHYLRLEAGSAFGAYDAGKLEDEKEQELRAYRMADGVIVVSDEDRRALESVEGIGELFLLPNVVPVRPRPPGAREAKVLFVGGYGHAPNVDAVVWFVGEVWPQVREMVPEARLTLAGAKATPEVLALGTAPGVEVAGFVAATEPYLDSAAVSIAPLRFGAGMKGKVCEAMASGVAVVTTTIGAQGLGLRDGEHALIADDARGFADGVVRLLTDPDSAERLGRAGQAHIAGICGPQSVKRRVEEMLVAMSPGARPLGAAVRWHACSAAHRCKGVAKRVLSAVGMLETLRSVRRRLVESEPGKVSGS